MKLHTLTRPLIVITLAAATTGGCVGTWAARCQPDSPPVLAGMATTNDCQLAGYAAIAREVNRMANPTPTSPVVDVALGSLIGLANAAAGYLSHRHATQKT